MQTQRPPLIHTEVVHVVACGTEYLLELNTDAVVLVRERREGLSGDDAEYVRLGILCSRPRNSEAGVVDPAGEMAHVDDEPINT
jgi:hypothetical protein